MSNNNNVPETEETAEASPTWNDPLTGLEWQVRSPGKMDWREALEYARSLRLDGKSDWRLRAAYSFCNSVAFVGKRKPLLDV